MALIDRLSAIAWDDMDRGSPIYHLQLTTVVRFEFDFFLGKYPLNHFCILVVQLEIYEHGQMALLSGYDTLSSKDVVIRGTSCADPDCFLKAMTLLAQAPLQTQIPDIHSISVSCLLPPPPLLLVRINDNNVFDTSRPVSY